MDIDSRRPQTCLPCSLTSVVVDSSLGFVVNQSLGLPEVVAAPANGKKKRALTKKPPTATKGGKAKVIALSGDGGEGEDVSGVGCWNDANVHHLIHFRSHGFGVRCECQEARWIPKL